MKKNTPAPIALFAYNRLDHLKITINNLKKNYLANSSELIIFSDGPKNQSDIKKIIHIREYLKKIKGFKKIYIKERKTNYGLSKNIIDGVSEILKKFKKIIVIEDDLVVNRYFLKYMNRGLTLYQRNKNVASIHGYVYPIKNINNKIQSNTFFIKGADCWGWATWKRAWIQFDGNGKKLLRKLINKKKIKEFNFNNNYDYFKMLLDQVNNKNDSWAIRWYASCFLKNMYTLYPVKTFVKNIGLDNTGQNSKFDLLNLGNKGFSKTHYNIKKEKVFESQIARKMFEDFFKKKKIFKIKTIIKNFLNV
jgi:hypothetical protein